VELDESDDDVGAALVPAPPLVEHVERLADPGRGAEVNPKRAATLAHGTILTRPGPG
jgi:hypothetical protein